jgi:hypothetical protein
LDALQKQARSCKEAVDRLKTYQALNLDQELAQLESILAEKLNKIAETKISKLEPLEKEKLALCSNLTRVKQQEAEIAELKPLMLHKKEAQQKEMSLLQAQIKAATE